MRFYLKRSKSDTLTAVCSQIHYNKTSFRYYLPIKVASLDWDFKSQRMRPMSDNSDIEFNKRLEWRASKIKATFYNYLNSNDDKMPSVEIFRLLLNKAFEKKGVRSPSTKTERLDFDDSRVIIIVSPEILSKIKSTLKSMDVQCIYY